MPFTGSLCNSLSNQRMLDEREPSVLSASEQAQWDIYPDKSISAELESPCPGYGNTVNQLHTWFCCEFILPSMPSYKMSGSKWSWAQVQTSPNFRGAWIHIPTLALPLKLSSSLRKSQSHELSTKSLEGSQSCLLLSTFALPALYCH